MLTRSGTPDTLAHESLVTLICIGIVASVLGDLTHEVLGHMMVGLLSGAHMTLLSSVGLQTVGPENKLLSAAGTGANVLAGVAALGFLLRRSNSLKETTAYFLLVFGAFNLMNCGYLVYSAVAQQGDWAAVINNLSPGSLWRVLLAAIGVAAYGLSVTAIARVMASMFDRSALSRSQVQRLVWTPYLSGAAVMTLAAVFNPFSASLILISGLGASLMINWGFLLAGGRIQTTDNPRVTAAGRHVNLPWLIAALLVGGLFIGLLGPGICLNDCSN